MDPHPKEGIKVPNYEGESETLASERIRTDNNLRIKIKFNPKPEPDDKRDSYLATPSKRNEDSRPLHLPITNNKRKTDEVDDVTCEECGKSFPSLKSKHGHMKSHPNRLHKRSKTQSTELASRSVKARRGHNSTLSEEDYIAAVTLIQMSRDDTREQENNIKMDSIKIEMDIKNMEEFVNSRKSGPPRMYECIICKKSFATHQALGGHTASHNKRQNYGEEARMLVESNEADPVHVEDWNYSGHHECKICGMTFSSGQALGGHKRKHWNGPNMHPVNTRSNLPIESSGESHGTSFRVAFDFDLNQTPEKEPTYDTYSPDCINEDTLYEH